MNECMYVCNMGRSYMCVGKMLGGHKYRGCFNVNKIGGVRVASVYIYRDR